MADITKIKFIVFFYDVGKSGNDFCVKENHAVPYIEKEFETVKKMQEYVR